MSWQPNYTIKKARLLGGCRDGDVLDVPPGALEQNEALETFEADNSASEPEMQFCVLVPAPFDNPRSKYLFRYTYVFVGRWFDMNTPYLECQEVARVLRSDPHGEPA
jgi:hypothetical protein